MDGSAHLREIEAWRQRRLARLTEPWSWLSLVDRVPLEPGTNDVGPGTFTFEPEVGVHFKARPGAVVTRVDGTTVDESTLPFSGSAPLVWEGRRYELLTRGDDSIACWVRVRDPNTRARREFPGLTYFPVDRRFRIEADWEAYDPPRRTQHAFEDGVRGDLLEVIGCAHFEIDGQALSLEPSLEEDSRRLHFLFGDLTNRAAPQEPGSYPAGRFLYADRPDGDRIVLDFNKAFNPPCAFTDYAVCPITPVEHRLPVAVPAGEQRPL